MRIGILLFWLSVAESALGSNHSCVQGRGTPLDLISVSDGTVQDIVISAQNASSGCFSKEQRCNTSDLDPETSEPTTPSPLPWIQTYNDVVFVTRGIYFPIVSVLAAVGNSIAITILRKDVLHSSSTIYLLGLAVADLCFVVAFGPTFCRAYSSLTAMRSYQTYYSYYVAYFFPFVNVFHTTVVWITIAFTVERFIAVAYPIKAQKYCTKSRARFAVASAFVFGISLNIVRFFRRTVVHKVDPVTQEQYSAYTYTNLSRNETFETAFFWIYFLATKVIPFPLLALLNSAVLWNVWRARWSRLKLTSVKKSSVDPGKSRENQITRMLVAIVTAFLLCNIMAGGASLYVALYGMSSIRTSASPGVYYLFSLGEVFINTNPLVNCTLYTACSQAMRKEMAVVFCPRRRKMDRDWMKSPPVTEEVVVEN